MSVKQKINGSLVNIAGAGATNAANVAYDNTESGLTASNAQAAIDEVVSEKQDKTDNTLTTTDKTISGAINEIDTALNNVILQDIKTVTLTFDANHFASGHIDVSKSGYMPIGICGYNIAGDMTVLSEYIYVNDLYYKIQSAWHTGEVSNQSFYILYIKSQFVL